MKAWEQIERAVNRRKSRLAVATLCAGSQRHGQNRTVHTKRLLAQTTLRGIYTASSRQWAKFRDCLGAVTKDGLGPLVRVHSRFTAESYCSILDDVALPFFGGEAFADGDGRQCKIAGKPERTL